MINLNEMYRHYKGGRYRALLLAKNSENHEETLVVYVSLGFGTVWARPLPMWSEEVFWPDGQLRPRFELESKLKGLAAI